MNESAPSTRALPFLPYAIVSVIHLVALFTATVDVSHFSKPLLMPALLVALLWSLPRAPGRIGIPAGLALFFSWLGDISLGTPGNLGFLIGLGMFFIAHLAYLALFIRSRAVARPPVAAFAYAIWWVAFVILLAPHTGSLVVPVAAYGLLIAAVASAAVLVNPIVALGAAFFLASDTLLGLLTFYPGFTPWQIDFAIMLLYTGGQGLIIVGLVSRRAPATAPGLLERPPEPRSL